MLSRRHFIAGLGCAVAGPSRAESAWSVALGAQPGSLRVTNQTGSELRLDRLVTVQFQDGEGWHPLFTEMALNVDCPPHGLADVRPGCVILQPFETIAPPPWLGFSCGGQCQSVCRANFYWGEGPFRFLVRHCDQDLSVASPVFRMPRTPQPVSGNLPARE